MRKESNAISANRALEMMPSGIFLPKDAVHTSNRVLIEAVEFADQDLPDLVDKFVQMQLHYPYVKPIFLISALSPGELSRAGFIYETVLTESSWEELGIEATYREYTERRVHEMISVYRTSRFSVIRPGQEIPRWLYER
ncbi:MAG: hypothetical protein ACTHZ9_10565 [Leucobacter sp.]